MPQRGPSRLPFRPAWLLAVALSREPLGWLHLSARCGWTWEMVGPGWEARTVSAESWAVELSHGALLVTGSGGPVP